MQLFLVFKLLEVMFAAGAIPGKAGMKGFQVVMGLRFLRSNSVLRDYQ